MAQDKLEIAKECGADVIINIGQKDPVATVKDMTGGYGPTSILRERSPVRSQSRPEHSSEARYVRRVQRLRQ
jgi:threonine dehydrogenase-like Zn-dependent dehydrogenase